MTKVRLSLVPPSAIIRMAESFQDGANKHGGSYNWRDKPTSMMNGIDKILRHTMQLLDGEDVSRDSLLSHLGAIAADAAVLIDANECGTLVDDRPTKGAAADMIEGRDIGVEILKGLSEIIDIRKSKPDEC